MVAYMLNYAGGGNVLVEVRAVLGVHVEVHVSMSNVYETGSGPVTYDVTGESEMEPKKEHYQKEKAQESQRTCIKPADLRHDHIGSLLCNHDGRSCRMTRNMLRKYRRIHNS